MSPRSFDQRTRKTCAVLIYPKTSSNRLFRGKNDVPTSISLRRDCSRPMLQDWEIASEKKIQTACNRRICRPAVGCASDINFSYASEFRKLTPHFLHGMFFNAVLCYKKCFFISYACVFFAFLFFCFIILSTYLLVFFFRLLFERNNRSSLCSWFVCLSLCSCVKKGVYLIAVNISRSACFRCCQVICFYFSYMNFPQKCNNNCKFIFIPHVVVKLNIPSVFPLLQYFRKLS